MSPCPYRAIALASALGALFCVSSATHRRRTGGVHVSGRDGCDAGGDRLAVVRGGELPNQRRYMVWRAGSNNCSSIQPPPAAPRGRKRQTAARRPLARVQSGRAQGLRVLLAPNTDCNDMRGPPPNVITVRPFARNAIESRGCGVHHHRRLSGRTAQWRRR